MPSLLLHHSDTSSLHLRDGFFEVRSVVLMRLPPSVTHHLSPRFPPIRHPAHAETSQRYVTRRLFLLLFRGGKNLKELSGQIAPIPRLLIPKPALRWAAGHLMSDGRTPAPTLTVGFLQAVGDASPHPGLPADPTSASAVHIP